MKATCIERWSRWNRWNGRRAQRHSSLPICFRSTIPRGRGAQLCTVFVASLVAYACIYATACRRPAMSLLGSCTADTLCPGVSCMW